MGFFSNIFAPQQETRSLTGDMPSWAEQIGGSMSATGVAVTSEKALSLTPVWAAIQLLSGAMGVFSLHTYRRLNSGKELATDHPLYRVLHDKPAENYTSFQWRKLMMTCELLWGCGISEILFDKHGYPVGLKPIHPNNVTPAKTTKGELVYHVIDDKGRPTVKQPHQLLLFPYHATLDGGWLSPIQVFRDTLGEGISTKEYGQAAFSQAMRPAAIISGLKGNPDEPSRQSIEDYFASYQGIKGTKKVLLLGEGVSLEKIGMPATDMQYLEARKFTTAEVGRIYGVPTHLIGDTTQTTWGTGIGQMTQGFITFSMLQHVKQWESEINAKLINLDNNQHFAEFDINTLLRADSKERMEVFKTGAQLGMYSINEMRAIENLNPIPNGNVRLVPMNMHTLEHAIEGIGNKADNEKENENVK